jgi:hypothetical protein
LTKKKRLLTRRILIYISRKNMNNKSEIKSKSKRSTSITRFRHRCQQMFDSARQSSIKRLVFFFSYSLNYTYKPFEYIILF